MTLRSAYRLAAVVGVVLLAVPAAAADLVLKRVVLSTGGVGYFEYEAQVDGDAKLGLDVPLDQVDDVLKSLAVYDAEGSAGEITLPGREPLSQSFADLPFDRAALNSEVDLLNALQGAEIRVAAPKAISGRLVHVDREAVAGPGGAVDTRSRVSVMTAAGLQQFVLQDVDAIAFADAKLQAQVDTALQRIAGHRAAARRELTLHLRGSGTRTVRVGYVVAMPLWKASYRLSLAPDAKAATARLQGWAILENFSGRAWQGVELTLLSGNPVTFRQALYESYYVPRPVVPVESGSRILPPPDSGIVAAQVSGKPMPLERKSLGLLRRDAENMAADATAAAAPAAPPPAPIVAAAAAEEATQIAFTPPYKVDVAAGQSLVLPLIDRELPVRRVDLYQPAVASRHPLAAIELANNSGSGLPPGVLTLYQLNAQTGALYLGDARLAALPPGDKRLLSYAVDGKTTVDMTTGERQPIVKARVADGVLHISRALRWTTDYRVKANAPAAPRLIVEQPRRAGAALTAPDPKTVELTPGAYRIPLALPASGDTRLSVVEEQPLEESIRLLDIDDDRLGAFVASSELDPQLRQALSALAARRRAVGRQRTELERLKQQRAQLVGDEARLRSNLAVLGGDPALHKRLLDKFTETETAIDTASAAAGKAQDGLDAAQRDLASYVAGLTL
ncbi:MAG TPA: DUF4139 domain-containing protein [Stellaceae bacterium]|nr:DUF4139 domain-containing protein [Stellaceae bacterium]